MTTGKNLLRIYTSSTCSNNIVNFGPLTAEIGLPVWGTPANFNGFRMLASLLQQRRSTVVNQFHQTLRDVWSPPVLVHYNTFSRALTEFCNVQNSLCGQVLRSLTLAALLHDTPVLGVSQTLQRQADGRATITLGVDLYSSCFRLSHFSLSPYRNLPHTGIYYVLQKHQQPVELSIRFVDLLTYL